jgi:hypothetical protein
MHDFLPRASRYQARLEFTFFSVTSRRVHNSARSPDVIRRFDSGKVTRKCRSPFATLKEPVPAPQRPVFPTRQISRCHYPTPTSQFPASLALVCVLVMCAGTPLIPRKPCPPHPSCSCEIYTCFLTIFDHRHKLIYHVSQ